MKQEKPVLAYGNKELRTKCEEADWKDRASIEAVLNTYHNLPKCAGLAANQVGVMKRIIVALGSVYINPVVISQSDEVKEELEGCMSFPQVFAKVVRPKRITLKWMNAYGREEKAKFKNYPARVILHEIDHLDGINFIDRISDEDWDKVQPEVTKVMLGDGDWPYDIKFNEDLKKEKDFEATRNKI